MGKITGPQLRKGWLLAATASLALVVVACGSSAAPTQTSTATAPTIAAGGATALPAAAPVPTITPPSAPPRLTPTPSPGPTEPDPSPTASPAPSFDADREIGKVEGITFSFDGGSEATFTVEEKLSRLPLPSDAVVRTTALSGEVHLDGRPSVIHIDLLQLRSDQSLRDRYIRDRMFRNSPVATFTLDDVRPLPEGFTEGEVVTLQITGPLEIRDVQVPITFDVEARDDGDVIFILGRTTFVWSDFGMTAPNIARIVQVTDEVSVEILLAVKPESP